MNTLTQTVATIDIGQSYIAIAILRRTLPAEKQYSLIVWDIMEFVPNSAPQQPLRRTGSMSRSGDTVVAPVKLTERQAARACGALIKSLAAEHALTAVVLEEQLDAARRNCIVMASIEAACAARELHCVSVHPSLKLQFQDTRMQMEAFRISSESTGAQNLKKSALDLYYYMMHIHTPCAVDLNSFSKPTIEAFNDHNNTCINKWYHKDLVDALLQGIHAINNALV